MVYPIKISYIPNSVVFRQNDLTAELLDVLTRDIENMGWTEIISKSKLSPSEISFLEDHNNRDMVLDTLNKRCQNVWTLVLAFFGTSGIIKSIKNTTKNKKEKKND